MTPTKGNPFLRGRASGRPLGLAGALAPMQARLERVPAGSRLTLTPIRAVDLAVSLPTLRPPNDAGDAAHTLLLGNEAAPGLAEAGGYAVADRPVLDDAGFTAVLGRRTFEELLAIRIAGPVEARDVAALERAIRRGDSALDFELRADVALELRGNRFLQMEVRDEGLALALVAEHFRHYLAALCNRPVQGIGRPDTELIATLLDDAGITVRPIESDVYSTFVDIGVCTTADDPQCPAERSLIYDLISRTWHGEG